MKLCVGPQAHLVAAFEQSLGNMTIRLQSLTTTAEQKVCVRKIVFYYFCENENFQSPHEDTIT